MVKDPRPKYQSESDSDFSISSTLNHIDIEKLCINQRSTNNDNDTANNNASKNASDNSDYETVGTRDDSKQLSRTTNNAHGKYPKEIRSYGDSPAAVDLQLPTPRLFKKAAKEANLYSSHHSHSCKGEMQSVSQDNPKFSGCTVCAAGYIAVPQRKSYAQVARETHNCYNKQIATDNERKKHRYSRPTYPDKLVHRIGHSESEIKNSPDNSSTRLLNELSNRTDKLARASLIRHRFNVHRFKTLKSQLNYIEQKLNFLQSEASTRRRIRGIWSTVDSVPVNRLGNALPNRAGERVGNRQSTNRSGDLVITLCQNGGRRVNWH